MEKLYSKLNETETEDVVISGQGLTLPALIIQEEWDKVMQIVENIKNLDSKITVKVKDFEVAEQHLVDEYREVRRQNIISTVPEKALKLGHFDPPIEMKMEVINRKIGDKYHVQLQQANHVNLNLDSSFGYRLYTEDYD